MRFYYKKVNSAKANRDGDEEYYIVEHQLTDNEIEIITAVNELYDGRIPVSVTYVNTQGMQSSKPFEGINIVVTRYSDGTTKTTKIRR